MSCSFPLPQSPSMPSWAPLAEAVLTRLTAWHAALSYPDGVPVPLCPADRVLMALRLAASLGSEDELARYLQPGTVLLWRGVRVDDYKLFRAIIGDALLPEGMALHHPARRPGADPVLQLIELHESLSPARAAEVTVPDALAEILPHPAPIWVTAMTAKAITPALEAGGTASLTLAPIGREVLQLVLAQTYPQADDAEALAASLPADAQLATLDPGEVLLALRAPDAPAAALRIAALIATRPEAAPAPDPAPAPARVIIPPQSILPDTSPAHGAALDLLTDFQSWRAGKVAWSEISHSLLLYGPPGTGKTWLAHALAQQFDLPLIDAGFGGWQAAGHLGNMLAAMRACFAEAQAKRPAILFIDEIDSAGAREDDDRHNRNYRRQVINEFLRQIDTLMTQEGVLLLGACNNPRALDPAITRTGRFDRKVELGPPNLGAITALLTARLGAALPEADLRAIARAALGRTMADLDGAIRSAGAEARRAGQPMTALTLRQHLRLPPETAAYHAKIARTAIHEAGHALVAELLTPGSLEALRLHLDGGEVQHWEHPGPYLHAEIETALTISMAGRAAEVLLLGEASSGAKADLEEATTLAIAIELTSGLGSFGLLYEDPHNLTLSYNPALRKSVSKRLTRAHARATTLLRPRQPAIRDLATRLADARELSRADIQDWIDGINGGAMEL